MGKRLIWRAATSFEPRGQTVVPEINVGILHGFGITGLKEHLPQELPAHLQGVRIHFGGFRALDYAFVLNDVGDPTWVRCDPERVWGFIQEPPTPLHTDLQAGRPYFSKVFTTDERLPPPRYEPYWGALQWATGLSYDEMKAAPYPTKSANLAWVTSNLTLLPGHRQRMAFLSELRKGIPELQLYGRGFTPIARKWDALAPSRYSIAFENFSGGIYWSEKLSDCFLSYSTPIYYGARNIDKYFPRGSYIEIDPDAPGSVEKVRDIIYSDFHEQNIEALIEARELCLKKYNTILYLAGLAKEHYDLEGPPRNVRWQRLSPAHPNPRWRRGIRKLRDAAVAFLPPSMTTYVRRLKHRLSRGKGRPSDSHR